MSYVSEHNKNYQTGTEYKKRQANYEKADAAIKALNSDPEVTSVHKHNYMSDMSEEELKSMTGFVMGSTQKQYADDLDGAPSANGIDWVQQGKVTPI